MFQKNMQRVTIYVNYILLTNTSFADFQKWYVKGYGKLSTKGNKWILLTRDPKVSLIINFFFCVSDEHQGFKFGVQYLKSHIFTSYWFFNKILFFG